MNEVGFSLRQEYFSKLALRMSTPRISLNTEQTQRENQYYKMILSSGLGASAGLGQDLINETRQVIDIGCRNWSYVQALSEFFPKSSIKGIEVDAGRRYWNLYRRIDLIRAYGQALRNAQRLNERHTEHLTEHHGDPSNPHTENRDITWLHADFRSLKTIQYKTPVAFCFFFPFVSDNPCLKWGLPKRFVCFQELLAHSIHLSEITHSPAIWISSHQGEWEAEIARDIYTRMGLLLNEYTLTVENFKDFWPSPYDTKIFTAKRAPTPQDTL